MIQAIRFHKDEFSQEILEEANLQITGDEVRIYSSHKSALLPVFYSGQNVLMQWGNKRQPKLPRTSFCKIEAFQAGKWHWLHPVPITVIASAALVNGIWFQVKEGIKALMIEDQLGNQYCYILTHPATHYFKTMTGAERMPILVNQIL